MPPKRRFKLAIRPLDRGRRWFALHTSLTQGLGWIAGAVGMVIALLIILGPLSWLLAGDTVRQLQGRDRADAINAVRQTLLTGLGGSAALTALAFTVRTYFLSRRGQITDRFGKAIEQLASDKLEERLGGIHALEHVMVESPVDHDAVVGVLCSFIKVHTPRRAEDQDAAGSGSDDWDSLPEPAPDIDAAMTVVARRPQRDEPNRPDLRRASLTALSIRAVDFARPPRLTRMFLTWADLRRADLRGADLRGSIATAADLRAAWLDGADLRRTSLIRADLRGASFNGAMLTGALLDGSDLRDVEGLTAGQLADARLDGYTRLPTELADNPWVRARISDCVAWTKAHPRLPWACASPTPDVR